MLNKLYIKISFKRKRLYNILKSINYKISNFILIAYYFNIKILINVAL